MNDQDQTGLGWMVVLRRQSGQIVAGRAEGSCTDAYELVCRSRPQRTGCHGRKPCGHRDNPPKGGDPPGSPARMWWLGRL